MSKTELNRFHHLWDFTRKSLDSLKIAKKYLFIQEETSSHFHAWFLPIYPWMIGEFTPLLNNIRNIADHCKKSFRNIGNKTKIQEDVQKLRRLFQNFA